MRRAAQAVNRQQASMVRSVPAPVGGWNARDSLAEMDARDAPVLINFWPTTSDVQIRQGYSQWSTGLPDQVWTVANYKPYSGAGKLFAASGAGIYDCTNGGAVGSAVVSGLSSVNFIHTQFSTPAGAFLYLVNGNDKPQLYDGTSWVAVDGSSTPAITGVTTTSLCHVNSFKTRLFFIENDSMNAWYLPVQSIGGAASKLDFTSVFKRGGYLMAMGTWSLDGGYGMDDYAVWVTSEGEIAVYRGTDPSSASTWELVGVYRLGSPMGRRCLAQYQGDLLYISKDGVSPLSKSLMSSRVNSRVNLSDKIQYAISNATTIYAANTGWEICLYPMLNMLLLNVPVSPGSQEQYCMNTITGSWTRFQGWGANCFDLWNDDLYFGGNKFVGKAWDTYADSGSIIYGQAIQAFSYFGTPANKHFKACRPVLTVNGEIALKLGINTDFDTLSALGSLTISSSSASAWDSATWDSSTFGAEITFGSSGSLLHDWQYIGGMGISAGLQIKTASNGSFLRWASTDYLFTPGSVI